MQFIKFIGQALADTMVEGLIDTLQLQVLFSSAPEIALDIPQSLLNSSHCSASLLAWMAPARALTRADGMVPGSCR